MKKRTTIPAVFLMLFCGATVFGQAPPGSDSNRKLVDQDVPVHFNHNLVKLRLVDVPGSKTV
ncbi:MAG: hypothetical protein NXI04_21085 [Planctomycetaceae bacterium]|nr:hypothetical protein [Planctomycetaceae bacterium]